MQIFDIVEELEKERKKNKELEDKIKELKADYGNKAQVERDLLQIRIDKAIEYITSTKWVSVKETLKILKGSDNNV